MIEPTEEQIDELSLRLGEIALLPVHATEARRLMRQELVDKLGGEELTHLLCRIHRQAHINHDVDVRQAAIRQELDEFFYHEPENWL